MFCHKYIEIIYIDIIMSVDYQLSLTQLFIRSSWIVYQHIDQCRVGYHISCQIQSIYLIEYWIEIVNFSN